jgi:16S rRNA processing protein RimM
VEVQVEHAEPAWVHAGSILRAHGVHGAMRVRFDISLTDLLHPLKSVRLVPRRGVPCVMHIQDVRDIHNAALLVLKEVDSREAAQLLSGASIEFPQDLIPPPSADDAYMYEIVGAQVQAEDGTPVGVVARVDDNGGQALLVIEATAQSERLLPLVPQTFRSFARETRVLTVAVPLGLWDA